MNKKQKPSNEIKLLNVLFRRTGLKWWGLMVPLIFSTLAAGLEGLSLGLIGPLGKGIVEKDFTFLAENSHYGWVFKNLRESSDRSYIIFFMSLMAAIFFVAVLKNCCDYISQITVDVFNRRFQVRLKQLVFDRYVIFGRRYFDLNNTDYLRNVLNIFVPSIVGGVSNIYGLISASVMLLSYLIVMVALSWQMALFSLLLYPIYYWSQDWLIKRIRQSSADEAHATTKLGVSLGSSLTGIPLVKAYTAEEREKKRYHQLNKTLAAIQFSILKKQALIAPIQEIITMVFTLVLMSGISFIVLRESSANVANFFVYFVILRRSAGKFSILTRFQSHMAKLDAPIMHVENVFSDEEKYIIPDGTKTMARLYHGIELKNLSFAYTKNLPILKNVSLHIPKGQMVALVGETGAGKTTIINLIMRYYDCDPNQLFVDGVDIRDLTFESLRKNIALVSQECILFDDTIKANVVYGLNRIISDDELRAVFEKARLSELIERLPDSWNTRIGERGMRLSGGEKQRLSIARAILKGCDILILDEATSSLDSKTEKLIQDAINEVIQGRTAIVIAHRLATIKNADKIIVLEKGQTAEEGSLQNLLSEKKKFYELWQAQKFL